MPTCSRSRRSTAIGSTLRAGPAAELYGAKSTPGSQAAVEALFARMGGQLQRSDIVLDFLRIMRRVPALPAPLQPLQGVLVKAAIEVIPAELRDRSAWARAGALLHGNAASCAAPAMQRTGSFLAPTRGAGVPAARLA